jgi:hypothetical protein
VADSVADVLTRHRGKMARLELVYLKTDYRYAKAVAKAFTNGATSVPGASDSFLNTARSWRTAVRDTYDAVKALDKDTPGRSLALLTYAQLDNAIYHNIAGLKVGKDPSGEFKKAKAFMVAYRSNNATLNRRLF